jgi:hypothetical protein
LASPGLRWPQLLQNTPSTLARPPRLPDARPTSNYSEISAV